MDETTRTRISIVCLGLIVSAIGVYLIFSYLSDILLSGIPLIASLAIIRYGYRYNPENKSVKRQKADLGSDAGKVLLIGMIMFFGGLGFGVLAVYTHNLFFLLLGALGFIGGFILIILGRIMFLTERKNQDSSDSSLPTAF
jgi:MFS family permease